jgi:peptide/nickel transport system permease protein
MSLHSKAEQLAADYDTGLSPRAIVWRRARSHWGLMIGSTILLVMVLLAIFAPLVAPHDPYAQSLAKRMIPPIWDDRGTWEHVLGTDALGRDYLSRLIHGARVSLTIGLLAALIGCIIGVTLGVCAGYFGGWVDRAINFLLTCQLALPGLLLAMALVFLIGPSLLVVILVIGVLHWAYYLVVTRAATMQIRQLDYVTASRAMGCTRWQIIRADILPNLANHIIVIFTLEVGVAVLAEASLSFLGVGVQAPTPSWGLMIAEGRSAIFFQPWLIILPGIALFLLVISTNLIGDGIRDITAPEGRN